MIYLLSKIILNRDFSTIVMKSMLLRSPKELGFGKQLIIDRLKTFAFLLMYPLYFVFRYKKNVCKAFVMEPTQMNDKEKHIRQSFVYHYFKSDTDEKLIPVINGDCIYLDTSDFLVKCLKTIKLWLLFNFAFLVSLFSKRTNKNFICARLLVSITNSIWIESDATHIYGFKSSNIICYLSMLYSSYFCKKNDYIMMSGNSFLYSRRYTFAPTITFALCSQYQKEEVLLFQKLGWLVVKNIIFTGLEEYCIYKDIREQKPCYDIGIYSSGNWARIDGLRRTNDFVGIAKYRYADNRFEKDFEKLLIVIANIKKQHSLKVKLYLHPYERMLLHEHNIPIPYLNIIRENEFEIDESPGSSIDKIYEVKIGVSLFSTIILDRWSFGLKGVFLVDHSYDDLIQPKFMGEYEKFFCCNEDELKNNILSLLKTNI